VLKRVDVERRRKEEVEGEEKVIKSSAETMSDVRVGVKGATRSKQSRSQSSASIDLTRCNNLNQTAIGRC
jgi:hypothetical protein